MEEKDEISIPLSRIRDLERCEKIVDALQQMPEMVNVFNRSQNLLQLEGHYSSRVKKYPKGKNYPSKIIWTCWLQGMHQAPPLCKACVASMNEHFPDYEIIVITEANRKKYVEMPDFIEEKYRAGLISRTHFSDLLRLALLVRYGGIWLDSTVYCTGYPKIITSEPLFLFKHIWRGDTAIPASSWLIAAGEAHPILRTLQDLLHAYWRENDMMVDYFLFHLMLHVALSRYPEEWKQIPAYSNVPPHILQMELFHPYDRDRFSQLAQMSPVHKLSYKLGDIPPQMTETTMYGHILTRYKRLSETYKGM